MELRYNNLDEFIDDIHKESVRDTIISMGYLEEEEMHGYMTRCCFHDNDDTPSLQISDNFFRCYGGSCGVKGDLIKFVMLYDKLNFIDACRKLADYFKVEIALNKEYDEYSKLKNKLKVEWDNYLKASEKLLSTRNEKSEQFKELAKDFFPLEVGYDEKTNRLVFPFTGKLGEIYGFTKRRINEEDEPKWIHSSLASSLVSKCHNIFNLNEANKHIHNNNSLRKIKDINGNIIESDSDFKKRKYEAQDYRFNSCILVEGVRDVASILRTNKYKNVISISGTKNFNSKVIETLEPIERFIFMLDGDNPGKVATAENICVLGKNVSYETFLNSYVAPIIGEKDPGVMTPSEICDIIANKKVKLIPWMIENSDKEYIVKLYKNTKKSSTIQKEIKRELMNHYDFSFDDVNEYLGDTDIPEEKEVGDRKKSNDFKKRLLATIGQIDDMNVDKEDISEEKARRILSLKYNYKFDKNGKIIEQ